MTVARVALSDAAVDSSRVPNSRIAIYAGSFDPITRGHEDLIHRSLEFVDTIVVAVATNSSKSPLFSIDERVALIRESLGNDEHIQVRSFGGLTVDFAREVGASLLIRGLRAVSDFEYEFQMAGMNRQLMPDVETVFMTPSDQFQFVSGTFVREIANLAGDVSKFVSPLVLERLQQRVRRAEA